MVKLHQVELSIELPILKPGDLCNTYHLGGLVRYCKPRRSSSHLYYLLYYIGREWVYDGDTHFCVCKFRYK